MRPDLPERKPAPQKPDELLDVFLLLCLMLLALLNMMVYAANSIGETW